MTEVGVGAGIALGFAGIQTADILIKQLKEVTEQLKPFKPDVKSFRIDYLERNSVIKFLLYIPDSFKRKFAGKLAIPMPPGFQFDEMWDLDNMKQVAFSWTFDGQRWALDVGKLPSSEKYWLTIKGKVSDAFLKEIVSVKAAENPSKDGDVDKFWVHSALKDVDILKRLWEDLNVERVSADVRIGVERMFTSAIPKSVKEYFELQKELLMAIKTGNRELEQRLKFRYRRQAKTRMLSPSELQDLLKGFVDGNFFSNYVSIAYPFMVNNIEPVKDPAVIVPEKVKVGVQTDLNYRVQFAHGDLCFHRKKFEESVSEKVKETISK